jgi:hypothetical protein
MNNDLRNYDDHIKLENEKEKLGCLNYLPGSCCKRDYISHTDYD